MSSKPEKTSHSEEKERGRKSTNNQPEKQTKFKKSSSPHTHTSNKTDRANHGKKEETSLPTKSQLAVRRKTMDELDLPNYKPPLEYKRDRNPEAAKLAREKSVAQWESSMNPESEPRRRSEDVPPSYSNKTRASSMARASRGYTKPSRQVRTLSPDKLVWKATKEELKKAKVEAKCTTLDNKDWNKKIRKLEKQGNPPDENFYSAAEYIQKVLHRKTIHGDLFSCLEGDFAVRAFGSDRPADRIRLATNWGMNYNTWLALQDKER